MTTASAPGKAILLGEHAVVYNRPAIAVPVSDIRATATVIDLPVGSGCTIVARNLEKQVRLAGAALDDPLALIVRLALAELELSPDPDWQIEIASDIPIAGGLGSGAAVSTALVRAVFAHAGHEPLPATVSRLTYRTEEMYHGTPSGIDNTVIAYDQPVWFVRGAEIETFALARSFQLVIADSGASSTTREIVGAVRQAWQQEPASYERWFDQIGELVWSARQAMTSGDIAALGPLMDCNQTLLAQIGVSSPLLETLIDAARRAGAAGAKLSGAGRGGNIIALVDEGTVAAVGAALAAAGARRVIVTTVRGEES